MRNYLVLILMILLVWLLRCTQREGYGYDNRPMEHENSLLQRNVWDDVDYQVPKFVLNRY